MKIADYSLQFDVQHQAASKHEVKESLQFENDEIALEIKQESVSVSLSQMAQSLSQNPDFNLSDVPTDIAPMNIELGLASPNIEMAEMDKEDFLEEIQDLQLKLMEKIIEKMFGREVKIYQFEQPEADSIDVTGNPNELNPRPNPSQAPAEANFSLIYQRHEQYQESEKLEVAATAIVRTESGDEINLDIRAMISREFMQSNHLEIRAGRALKDPLVINFNGELTQLQNETFVFDIDSDGETDELNQLDVNSAFIAIDKNNNGEIDNGTELFGAETGDGFKELSQYDEDNNGVIDENDAIFAKLKAFRVQADGTQQLMSLSQAKMGAIFLETADAPFQYKNAQNELQGALREVSLGLTESAQPVFVQQIDFAV